jgi:hypothetical protein
MSPNNGVLVVGTPLYRRIHVDSNLTEPLQMYFTDHEPMAYVMDCGFGKGPLQILSAEWVEEHLECLGNL